MGVDGREGVQVGVNGNRGYRWVLMGTEGI